MKNNHHSPRRLTALLLVVAVMLSLIPSAFAVQQNSYHDPAEHWQEALNRTNELDANSVVTVETFNCCVCDKATAFEVFRVPEYTRNGETALTRNVKYSDGTCLDGKSKGDLLDGTPGQDAYYTGYHWTKAVCEVCGTINSNMGATSYACNKNVYWLYDCAADFFEELPETQTVEQVDSTYHRIVTTSGEYCAFCYGTYKEESSALERHHMETAIRPELAHDRFVEMDTCADCGYAETAYTAAKAVIADYFGVVDGQPHTVTVSDLSEAGVTTAIRYGHTADGCTLTSAPNYTEAGDYAVYYASGSRTVCPGPVRRRSGGDRTAGSGLSDRGRHFLWPVFRLVWLGRVGSARLGYADSPADACPWQRLATGQDSLLSDLRLDAGTLCADGFAAARISWPVERKYFYGSSFDL
ncbi:hypothetical protein [Flavonifractor sp. An82]|uniref:hypothetical protein n=1 Tax=Flavonifractor sp. An82 TaxID=1965660 RepID=UPI001FA93556|nr:hypothetical protein [Flavonifractor sp. An82]